MNQRARKTLSAAQCWGIFSRLLAASLGGYGLTSLLAAVLALALPLLSPLSRADGVLLAGSVRISVFKAC